MRAGGATHTKIGEGGNMRAGQNEAVELVEGRQGRFVTRGKRGNVCPATTAPDLFVCGGRCVATLERRRDIDAFVCRSAGLSFAFPFFAPTTAISGEKSVVAGRMAEVNFHGFGRGWKKNHTQAELTYYDGT